MYRYRVSQETTPVKVKLTTGIFLGQREERYTQEYRRIFNKVIGFQRNQFFHFFQGPHPYLV